MGTAGIDIVPDTVALAEASLGTLSERNLCAVPVTIKSHFLHKFA